jgi:hypothetical protein
MLTANKSQTVSDDNATQDGAVLDLSQYLHKVKVSKTLIVQADDLALEHERFHTNYVIAGRMALYALLGKIYELVLKVEGSDDCDFFVDQMRKSLKSKHSIRTQENSSTAAIVVRYVTRADRKTAHVYARAIEAAKASHVPAVGFSDYVDEQGGVEKIRSNQAQNGKPATHARTTETQDVAKQPSVLSYLRARSEFPKSSFAFKSELAAEEECEYSVFVCRKRHGRYLVLDQLDLSEDTDLRELLEDGLESQINLYKANPQRFDEKARLRSMKREMSVLRKRNPAHYQAVLKAVQSKDMDQISTTTKRSWIASKLVAQSQ